MPEPKSTNSLVGSAVKTTLRGANSVGRSLMGLHNRTLVPRVPGKAAGIEHHELTEMAQQAGAPAMPAVITCFDYSKDHVEFQDVTDLEDFILRHRPTWSQVRWINVDGVNDPAVIRAFAEKYELHPLAIEDVLHIPQRPKVETYAAHGETHGRIFIVTRIVKMLGTNGNQHPQGEQVSIFLGHNTVLTFQEKRDGDVFDNIRDRIRTAGSRIRDNDASFLVYALLDAVVDHCFPILEHYSDLLEELEDEVLARPDKSVIQRIHGVKRELLLLRRAVWPMREVISNLSREHHECLSATTQTYLRDVYDHTVQIIDMVETYREFASGLTETYMSAMSNRMNEIMKVLTIMTTIFVPLTFLAGVYGMNFHHLPELEWYYAYYVFWGICFAVAATMLLWFRWRKWL